MKKAGISIGEGYAKQGLSWDEVSNMPSSGNGPGRDSMLAGAKIGYDNYMANKSQSIGSDNMINSLGGSGGLAASAVKPTSQPALTSEIQNTAANNHSNMWQPNSGNDYQVGGGLGNINFPQLGVANNPGIGINQQNTLGQENQFNNEKSSGLGNLSAYGWNRGIGNNVNNN